MGHGHGHGGHGAGREADRRRLRWVLVVTATVLVVEVVGAFVTDSLALLADAGHMATDAGAVVLALGASYVAGLPGSERSTFGYHRVEVVAALLNAVVLLGVCGYLGYAGVTRIADPGGVHGGGLIGFALVGLAANATSLVILSRGRGDGERSLNMRGALNEVVADLLGSVLAVLVGVAIVLWDWQRADPIASLVIAALILPRALLLLRDSGRVLLEIAPADLDVEEVRRHLLESPGVVGVHDLHAWTITSGLPSLSAHVTVTDAALAERGVGAILDDLSDCLADHFGLDHTTLQIEPESHLGHEHLGDMH